MPNEPSKAIDRDANAQSLSIPDGLVLTIGPDGEHRIVPEFLIPATDQAFAVCRERTALRVRDEQGGVSVNPDPMDLSLWMPMPMPISLPMPMPISMPMPMLIVTEISCCFY
jgi:hypothetical protein